MNAPMLLLGGLLLGTGAALSRRQRASLGWLGDDPTPPSGSFDPSRSTKTAYRRTHLAKKFWGATILAAQAAVSMDKLAIRMRESAPQAAAEAKAISNELRNIIPSAGSFALKYDEPWVRYRMKRSGIAFELEPEPAR